jgi:putative aminopeptidase FrvX
MTTRNKHRRIHRIASWIFVAMATGLLALVVAGPPARGISSASAAGEIAPPQSPGADRSLDVAELIRIPGVAGYEEPVREHIAGRLPAWARAQTDNLGNLVVTFGSGTPHTLLVAPLDERGYVISDITEDGYLRLYRASSAEHPLYDQYHYGQPVNIQTAGGAAVPAVSSTVSTHIRSDGPAADRDRIRDIDDLWIDLGADSRDEVKALGVRDLDPVELRDSAVSLAGGRVAGSNAQGRGAAAVLLDLIAGLNNPNAVTGTVSIAWVAQSTFRDLGLQHLARRIKPDRAFLFTTASLRGPRGAGAAAAAAPDRSRGGSGTLGGGPLIDAADKTLATAASSAGIPFQALAAGSVGRSINTRSLGWEKAEIHLMALPVRYAQTPVEMIDTADIVAAGALLRISLGVPAGSFPKPAATAVRPKPAEELVAAVSGTRPTVSGSFRTLQKLVEVYGVSGQEEAVRKLLLTMLPGWADPETDEEGNITVTAGSGDRHLIFIAHQDEIGYEVFAIKPDGSLGLRVRGGGLDALYEAHPALVHTGSGALAAVIAPRPDYTEAKEFNPRGLSGSLAADLGTESAEETKALGVAVGNMVTVPKRFQPLAGTRATARSVDDRVGCTALILALQRLDPSALHGRRITFAFSIAEETGLVGAGTIASRTPADAVFSVDTFVSSASPVDWQRRARVPLGAGPVVKVLDGNHVTPRAAVDRMFEVLRPHGIPLTLSITGGGTDAGAFIVYGAVPVPIGWPSRYSHSPVELMDRADLDELIDMVLALAYEY